MSNQSRKRIPIVFPFVVSLLFPVLLATTSPARGQELTNGLLQESTLMVVNIDTAKLGTPEHTNLVRRLPESVRLDLLPFLNSNFQPLQSEADRTPVQVFVSMPVSGFVPTVLTVRRQSEAEINRQRDLAYFQQRLKNWQVGPDVQIRLDGKQIIVGPPVVDPLPAASARELANQFSNVLNSIGDLPIRIAIVPPRYVRETLANTVSELPQALGGLPTSVVLEGIQSIGIGFDPQSLILKLQIQSADKAAAQLLAESLPTMLRSMYLSNPWSVERLSKEIVFASIDQLPIEVQDDMVVLTAEGETVGDVHLQLLGAMVSAFAGKQRTMSASNQMKRIGLAVHNHHSAFRFLPPWQSGLQKPNRKAVKEKTNTQLSWRVYLLPFVGHSDLFQQFHLNEPWDSPHNKTLLGKMPEIYAGGSRDIPDGHTTIVAPLSDQAMLNAREPTSFLNVVDGLSNTVMVVEVTADSAVPWTAPQDYEFDPANPFAKMAVDNSGHCNVLFGDGSVKKLRKDLQVQQAKALFGRDDGISIKLD